MNDFIDTQMCVNTLRKINYENGLQLPYNIHLRSATYLCLDLLEKKSLIKYEKDEEKYKITHEGIQYLNSFDKFIEIFSQKNRKKEQIVA